MPRLRQPLSKLIVLAILLMTTPLANASLGKFLYESNRSFEAWLANLEQSSTQINDDQWHYYARNLNQENCTVLVHGFTAEAAHWFRFARKLGKEQCLIIPDLPGFGQSSYDPAEDYSIPRQAQRLHAFLQQIKPAGKLHLAGSSMGGHIVATYTLDFPERVASLTLFNAAGVESPEKSYNTTFLETHGKPIFHIEQRSDFYHLMQYSMSDAPWMPGVVVDFLADQFIERNARHMHIFGQIHSQNLIDQRLAELTAPALVIWGNEDHLLDKSMGTRYASLLPNAVHTEMPKIGHLPFMEAPAASATTFVGFITRL